MSELELEAQLAPAGPAASDGELTAAAVDPAAPPPPDEPPSTAIATGGEPDEPTGDDGPTFTAPEKIRSLVELLLAKLDRDETKSGRLIRRAINLAKRFGLLDPFLAQLPPADQPDEWDAMLGMFVGVAWHLFSDDVQDAFDLEASKLLGAEVLARVFANESG